MSYNARHHGKKYAICIYHKRSHRRENHWYSSTSDDLTYLSQLLERKRDTVREIWIEDQGGNVVYGSRPQRAARWTPDDLMNAGLAGSSYVNGPVYYAAGRALRELGDYWMATNEDPRPKLTQLDEVIQVLQDARLKLQQEYDRVLGPGGSNLPDLSAQYDASDTE